MLMGKKNYENKFIQPILTLTSNSKTLIYERLFVKKTKKKTVLSRHFWCKICIFS